ncbi:MAG: hypothetical protein AAGA77_14295 [Bacteroidota bacterium]
MKKNLKVFFGSILILILFRGFIFRSTIHYQPIGIRPAIELTNRTLIEKIETTASNEVVDLKSIANIAIKLTSELLKFSTKQTSNNPNELMYSQNANCVGYSAMYTSIANHLIEKYNLQNEISAEHKIGQLELLGFNLHRYFDDPFFKDHDFNVLTNRSTGEQIVIDPSVSDYLWIHRVSQKE